jgi:glycosyltransferase 2 family protein
VSPSQRLTLRIILAGAVLVLLFRFVPLAEVGAVLGEVAPGYLALGVLLQFLMRAVATPRMHVIATGQGIAISHWQLFRILLITQYYALMLPGVLATGGATWLKYVQAGAAKTAAVAAVMLNRGIGTLVMVAAGAIAWLLTRGPGHSAMTVLLAAFIAALLLVAIFGRGPVVLHAPDSARGASWLRWVRGLGQRLLQFQQISTQGKLVVLGSSLAHELVGALTLWCFALAVGLSLDLLTIVWMRAALQVALMAPVHVAGLGVREASLAGLGALVGVAPAVAVAWALVIFAGSLVVSAAGGLLEADAATRYFTKEKNLPLTGRPRDSES